MCGWAYEGARDAQRAALEGGAGPPDGEEAVELGVGVELEELRVRPAAGAASARWDTALAAEGAAEVLRSDRRAEGRRHLEGGRDDERVAAHAVEGVHVLGPPPKADRHLRQQRISAADQLLQEMPALSERAAPAADLPELVEQTVQVPR